MTPDQHEEISASVAAHAELGPRYDSAVAEGLIERIGEEIDKRVDARLRATGAVVSHHASGAAQVLMVLLIWTAIAIINVAHSQRS